MLKRLVGCLWVVLGYAIAICGIGVAVGGIYYAVAYMLFGGVIDLINQIKAPETDGAICAWAVVKIVFTSFVVGVSFWVGVLLVGVGSSVGTFGKPKKPVNKVILDLRN